MVELLRLLLRLVPVPLRLLLRLVLLCFFILYRVRICCAICCYSRCFQIFGRVRRTPHRMHGLSLTNMYYLIIHICFTFCTHSLHIAFVPPLPFNGGPALVARKPVVLLIPHLFQHQTGFGAFGALKFANFVVAVVVVVHWLCASLHSLSHV